MPPRDRRDPPLLNPVLSLQKEAAPEPVTGGGKRAASIVADRLEHQRLTLAASVDRIALEASSYAPKAGKLHVVARMFPDSFAPTWTPKDLFEPRVGCALVAPARGGYLVEVSVSHLAQFAQFVRSAQNIEAKVDISRVDELRPFDMQELLRGQTLDDVWNNAADVDGGRAFIMWLAPYRDEAARAAVIQTLTRLVARVTGTAGTGV